MKEKEIKNKGDAKGFQQDRLSHAKIPRSQYSSKNKKSDNLNVSFNSVMKLGDTIFNSQLNNSILGYLYLFQNSNILNAIIPTLYNQYPLISPFHIYTGGDISE